jgi:ferredoxin
MVPLRVTGKVKGEMRPIVNDDRCIGCGVCAGACRSESIEMERRSDQPHVPQNAIEKAVRTSLEKGRLAQLVFDEGESRGAAFLAGVVQAVSHLPGPKQALASEHLQSRFVAYALANVRDPSAG